MVAELKDFPVVFLADFFIDSMEAGHGFWSDSHWVESVVILSNIVEITCIRTATDQARYDDGSRVKPSNGFL